MYIIIILTIKPLTVILTLKTASKFLLMSLEDTWKLIPAYPQLCLSYTYRGVGCSRGGAGMHHTQTHMTEYFTKSAKQVNAEER